MDLSSDRSQLKNDFEASGGDEVFKKKEEDQALLDF